MPARTTWRLRLSPAATAMAGGPTGGKKWFTGVEAAQKMLVIARTTKVQEVKRRTEGLSMFLIDVERKGLTYSPIEKLGTNTLSSCRFLYEHAHVVGAELVGTLDGGWYEMLDGLNTDGIVTTRAP